VGAGMTPSRSKWSTTTRCRSSPPRWQPGLHGSRRPCARHEGDRLIGTVNQARKEAEAGVDIVVAQGHEGWRGILATWDLPPGAPRGGGDSSDPSGGGGGYCGRRGLVASLALGAAGVWCGTAFLCTPEAGIEEVAKQKIIAAQRRTPG